MEAETTTMDGKKKIVFAAFLILAASIDGACGYTMVSGTVFCDQCKDGQVSLFDYPLYGIKVAMACPGSNGQYATVREETTNWLGNYVMRFDGTPNLNGCYARVSGSVGQVLNGCGAVAGPPKYARQVFNIFYVEMYTVDPLLAQPSQPMPFCPAFNVPNPAVAPVVVQPPPPALPPPVLPLPPPPVFQLPPFPPFPPFPPIPTFPPIQFSEASACPFRSWMMSEYRCYWKPLNPDAKVADVFGPVAERVYGGNTTLWEGLTGRGDPYKTLLREGTTSLLNSYSSVQFPYRPSDIIERMNTALTGSVQQVLQAALSFMRANAGEGTNSTCGFTTCSN